MALVVGDNTDATARPFNTLAAASFWNQAQYFAQHGMKVEKENADLISKVKDLQDLTSFQRDALREQDSQIFAKERQISDLERQVHAQHSDLHAKETELMHKTEELQASQTGSKALEEEHQKLRTEYTTFVDSILKLSSATSRDLKTIDLTTQTGSETRPDNSSKKRSNDGANDQERITFQSLVRHIEYEERCVHGLRNSYVRAMLYADKYTDLPDMDREIAERFKLRWEHLAKSRFDSLKISEAELKRQQQELRKLKEGGSSDSTTTTTTPPA